MRKRDPERNMARFYALRAQAGLFGGWALVREWGRIGSPGQLRIEPLEDLAQVEDRAAAIAAVKRRRGYG